VSYRCAQLLTLLAAMLTAGAALAGVPASDGGTALLYGAPPGRIRARFGPASFAAHRAAAHAAGLELREIPLPDALLGVDLDTPEDAETIARGPYSAHTVTLLRRLLT